MMKRSPIGFTSVVADHDGGTDTALPPPDHTYPMDGEATHAFELDDGSDLFFIEIVWYSEGDEYPGDLHDDVSLTKAVLDEGTPDQQNVLAYATTQDGYFWTIAVPNIGLGAHTMTFNAEDDAGNTLATDEALTFEVEERGLFDLGLVPGINLIPLPRDPADTDINAVFGDTPVVDLVFTRQGRRWLVAQRDPDTGRFERTGSPNDLWKIDAKHAYFVRAVASVTVEIDIPPLGTQRVPPKVRVKGNRWSLVPVTSLGPIEDIPQFTEIDADDYLGENWKVAFTFGPGPVGQRVARQRPGRRRRHPERLGPDRPRLLGVVHQEGLPRPAIAIG